MPKEDLALLLRLNKSWYEGIPADELYEITRAWWVMSAANAHRVVRVLAVAGGIVREAYEPTEWLSSPVEGLENRIGFNGVVAIDREMFVGRDVAHLFRPGSANPVRYLPLDALLTDPSIPPSSVAPTTAATPTETAADEAVEPGLLERVLPLLDAFEHDLLWAQSRGGQELFHSNTIAWLLKNFPGPTVPVLELLGATQYQGVRQVEVWRERRHLDIVIDPVGARPKIVVENKLYSVPYPAQLIKYNTHPLPWSPDHDESGAPDTRYALSVAVAALRSRASREVAADDHAAVLKVWSKRHRDLARNRNQVVCRLHAVLCDLVPGGHPRKLSAAQAARILKRASPSGAVALARAELAAEFLADLRHLDTQLRDTRKKLAAAVKASRTTLTEVFGVGPVIAGTIIGDAGDAARFPSRDHFAACNGTAPVEVSSGNRKVHRLSLRGNRRINHAIHMAAITQISHKHSPGRAYYDRR